MRLLGRTQERVARRGRAGAVDDWADGEAIRVRFQGRAVAVFRVGERFFALEDRCPHQGTPLSDGDVEGAAVRCSGHGLKFDLTSGRCATSDAMRVCRYHAEVHDGAVWLSRGDA